VGADEHSDDSVVSYLLATQEKLWDMAEIVEENSTKVQGKQKRWYDKGARLREFKKGDPVLVLLPPSSSKLLAQWQGPYQIMERTGKVTYQVDMHDKRKRRRVFHVNMLKTYQVRSQEQLVTLIKEMPDEDSEANLLLWNDSLNGTLTVREQLTEQQRIELQGLLTEIEDVLQANPGRTTLGEHHIRANDAKPVKLPRSDCLTLIESKFARSWTKYLQMFNLRVLLAPLKRGALPFLFYTIAKVIKATTLYKDMSLYIVVMCWCILISDHLH